MKKHIIIALLASITSFGFAQIDIQHGIKAEQNARPYQEDRFTYAQIAPQGSDLLKNGGTFVAVYDGHGGDKTSSFLGDNLHNYFTDAVLDYEAKELCCEFPFKHAFDEAFFIAEKHALENFWDGSTAVAAYIENKDEDDVYMHCAWVGDSRLVLDNGFATEDHKPDRADEKERIEDAGGQVYMHGVWRVNGLAVSRSIGDGSRKGGKYDGHIIATPEYAKIKLTPDNKFFIIASDGLWDVMNNNSAINMVKKQMQKTDDLGAIAQSLLNKAKKRGSLDNITVSVVKLNLAQKMKKSH